LKGTGKEIGLLVNFGRSKMEYKRLYNPDIKKLIDPEHPKNNPIHPVK
jgi:hypothetical protein